MDWALLHQARISGGSQASAHYNSNRAGLYDDMLTVLQAVYCDFYITEDKKQSAYASLLLTPFIRFEIYRDRNTPVDQWILSLL